MKEKRGEIKSVALTGVILIVFILTLLPSIAYAQTASIRDNSGNVANLFFTGQSTSPNKWYQDAISTNPDVGIQICDIGQKYVGGLYAMDVNGVWKYVPITYKSSTDALSYTDVSEGNGCYATNPGDLTFSPSHLTTPNPNIYYAAYPGRIWVGYADSPNPGTINNFIFTNENGKLLGSYLVDRSFSESTDEITIQTPKIVFQTQSGSFNKDATDSTFGVTNERRMVVGVCSDDYGSNCSDGYVVPTEKSFPMSLSTGLTSSDVNDQHTYIRYVVINGEGNQICIGANLKVSIDSVTPNPVYYGQTLNIKFTISNPRDTPYEVHGGNVGVTHPFDVKISIYNASNPSQIIYQTSQTITSPVGVGGVVSGTVNWLAQAHSGDYTVKIDVDSNNNIKECDESDNSATANFKLKPVYLPNMRIDGLPSTTFQYPGVPYNVSIHLTNSDGENVSDATLRIVEENGIDILAPTQVWNETLNGASEKTGVKSYNIAEFKTDGKGDVSLTIIPTGNKLYSPEYNYTNISSYVGDYKIYLMGWTSSGDNLIFTISGSISQEYPLSLQNPFDYQHANYKNFPNKNGFVKQIMEFVYENFATFWKSIIT